MEFDTSSGSPSEVPKVAAARQVKKQIMFEGMKLAYDTCGTGEEALVFVHGWTCCRALWAPQAPLYQNYRSILVDLPGHGESDAPHVDYHLELFTHALAAILEQEQIHLSVIVAHSMGGPVATLFLRKFPDRVAGIVYVDSFLYLPEHYLFWKERKQLARNLEDDSAFAAKVETLFTVNTPISVKELVHRAMLATPKHVRITATTSDIFPPVFAHEQTFEIPAIHIAAPKGFPMHPQWFHHIPKLCLRQIEGVGHFLFLEKPERFNEEVQSFLQKNGLLQ